MRCGRRVCAAGIAAAAFFFFYLGAVTDPARAGDEDDARIMLFSGRDLWRNGAFVYGGFVLAPSGFDQDGLLLKLLSSGGVYRYEASNLGNPRISGIQLLSQVLPGWRIKRGDAEFNLSSDPNFRHNLSPDDPSNRLRGASLGLRIAAELWYEPTPKSMIAADVSLSSV